MIIIIPTRPSHAYYYGLLASLLAIFLIAPFIEQTPLGESLLGIGFITSLIFSVVVIRRSKKSTILAGLLAMPLLYNIVIAFTGIPNSIPDTITYLCGTVFVFLVIAVMLKDMFSSTEVDTPLIIGAISLYLLLGLIWGFAYAAIEEIYPNSFGPTVLSDSLSQLMYYSIVTLTTLGYGDIVPLSPPARAMAAVQAVVGQIYLTVLVARLVGMHIAQNNKRS